MQNSDSQMNATESPNSSRVRPRWRKRWMWLASLCLAATASLAVHLPATCAAEKNIILFVADDWGLDADCYGNEVIRTPNIDAIAKESTVFDLAFATTASCSASRSVILTGLHNHASGQYGHLHNYHKFGTHAWVKSLPALLKAEGYRTARVGKYHVGPDDVYPFDTVIDANERDPVGMSKRCRELFSEDSDQPFFLLYATGDPHRGGGFADEIAHRPDRFGNPAPGKTDPANPETIYQPDEVKVPEFLPDSPATRSELAQYYQSVSRMDRGLGKLIELLKSSGQWDDTLLLITSDHGVAFAGAKTTVYDPGLHVPLLVRDPYQKKQAPRSNAMVSLLDVTPTLLDFAGGLKNGDVQIADTQAKKWEWRTFEPGEGEDFETGEMRWLPYRFHGRSFYRTLHEASPEGWDAVSASHTFHEIQMYYPMRVYRDRKYKLIWNIAHPLRFPFASDLWTSPTWQSQLKQGQDTQYGPRKISEYLYRPQFELYDIEADPNESNNLASSAEHADVLERYKQKLRKFQAATGDPWELKWHYE